MKRILFCLLGLLVLLPITVKAVDLPEKTDHEKVTIYIFRGHGCSHCYDALEYFYNNHEKYDDYFNVVTYEVWNNKNNSELMQAVSDSFNDDASGVPYIVIGSNYSNTQGFGETIVDGILEAAFNAYQDEEYQDLVKELAKSYEKTESKNLEESCIEEGIVAGKYDTLIAFVIIFVVLGGGALLIKFARK